MLSVVVISEIVTQAEIDYEKVVWGVISSSGIDSYGDDVPGLFSISLCVSRSLQSCSCAATRRASTLRVARVGTDGLDVGALDLGIVLGCASDGIVDCIPLSPLTAACLGNKLTDVRVGGLRVMFEYASDDTEGCLSPSSSMDALLRNALTDMLVSGSLWLLRSDGKTQMAFACNRLMDVCVGGLLWRLQPDDKTQVIIVYRCHEDGAGLPQYVHMWVISV